MPGLLSIPLELLFLVVGYLPADDIKSVRLTCTELNQKTAGVHKDALFQCRTYFATIPDLEALLALTRHSSGANLRLKHLRIDVASPYIHIRPNLLLNSLGGDDEEEELRPPKLFNRTCFAFDCHNFEGLKQSEDQALIFAALQNLPNLEVVEFVDRQGIPSEKSLAMHYPLSTNPEYKDQFMAFYKDHAVRQRRDRMTTLLFYVMAALKHAPCRVKEILVDNPRHGYMYTSLGWFDSHRRHISRLAKPLENLRVLEMNLCYPWPPEDHRDFDEFGPIKLTEGELQCLPEFLSNTVPNIEKLRLNFAEILPELNTNNLHVWIRPEGRRYEPTFFLKKMEIKLPRIKRFEFVGIPFVPEELIEVLLSPHKNTLRHLMFEDCVLQETPQCWSTIFSLLKEELTLETFSFVTKTVDRRISLVGKMPHVFKVQGHVHTSNHRCEVQPSGKKPLVSTTYWEALDMIVDFEAKLLDSKASGEPHGRNENDRLQDDEDDDESSDSYDGTDTGDWPIGVWDELDDFDDDDDDDGIGPMGHFGHIGHMGPPLPLPPLPVGLPGLLPPLPFGGAPETYTVQGNAPRRVFFAHPDPQGRLIPAGLIPQSTYPVGSVVVHDFIVPGTMIDTAAMEGQPITTQNVIRNLLPGAFAAVAGNAGGQDSGGTASAATVAAGTSGAGASAAGTSTSGASASVGPLPSGFQTAAQLFGFPDDPEDGLEDSGPPYRQSCHQQ
ncbi:hypothetical protein TWF281_002898 [Arthrobotrys megalospora]